MCLASESNNNSQLHNVSPKFALCIKGPLALRVVFQLPRRLSYRLSNLFVICLFIYLFIYFLLWLFWFPPSPRPVVSQLFSSRPSPPQTFVCFASSSLSSVDTSVDKDPFSLWPSNPRVHVGPQITVRRWACQTITCHVLSPCRHLPLQASLLSFAPYWSDFASFL